MEYAIPDPAKECLFYYEYDEEGSRSERKKFSVRYYETHKDYSYPNLSEEREEVLLKEKSLEKVAALIEKQFSKKRTFHLVGFASEFSLADGKLASIFYSSENGSKPYVELSADSAEQLKALREGFKLEKFAEIDFNLDPEDNYRGSEALSYLLDLLNENYNLLKERYPEVYLLARSDNFRVIASSKSEDSLIDYARKTLHLEDGTFLTTNTLEVEPESPFIFVNPIIMGIRPEYN
jgi:hypothetical protein